MKPQASTIRPVCRHARVAAAAALLACSLPSFGAPDWDMVGIRLGMTEAEVLAAFRAYDPKGKISASRTSFSYNDGVSSHRTPAFLSSMEMSVTRLSIQTPLRVWFSGPVGEVRVIGVARNESNLPNPASRAQYLQGLQQKYGAPTAQWTGSAPFWQEQGKPSCIATKNKDQVNFGEFPQVSTGHKNLTQAVDLLQAQQQQPGSFYVFPADLESCGAFMYYTAGMDPVASFTGGMFDVGAIVATQRSRNAWVEKMKAEATRKRVGQGQAPRF